MKKQKLIGLPVGKVETDSRGVAATGGEEGHIDIYSRHICLRKIYIGYVSSSLKQKLIYRAQSI